MTTDLTEARTAPALSREQADRGTARLRHLLPSLRDDEQARTEARQIAGVLTIPADPTWIAARVISLLNPYFEKDTPQAVREMEAEDWTAALESYPKWAVDSAVKFWKGADNPDRRKRPLEGDIAARCKFLMQECRAVEIALRSPIKPKPDPDVPRPEPTAKQKEEANAMVAELGLNKTRGLKPQPSPKNEDQDARPDNPSA